jgi:hypothetical protein
MTQTLSKPSSMTRRRTDTNTFHVDRCATCRELTPVPDLEAVVVFCEDCLDSVARDELGYVVLGGGD